MTVGGVECVVSGVQDDQVNCTIGAMPAGNHDIEINVAGKGKKIKKPGEKSVQSAVV